MHMAKEKLSLFVMFK